MATSSAATSAGLPPWQGMHHVALVTPDLDATIVFYQDILGMAASPILPASPHNGRHCFIKPGATDSWGLHIFEQPEAQIFAYPREMPRFAVVPGALQHIAFALPDEAAALLLRERLERHGVAPTPFTTLGRVRNMLFHDNNGLLLEATWPAPEGR
jgi:catechol 2,3-dioxygenase-like lactoylglutathione lyase family enzyme